MMRYLCTEKNKRSEDYGEDINNHPMLIRTQEIEKTRNFQQLKRKSLNAFFNEDDEAKLYVFYGKVQLKLKKLDIKKLDIRIKYIMHFCIFFVKIRKNFISIFLNHKYQKM